MKIVAESQVPKNPGYFHLAYLAASHDAYGVGVLTVGTGIGFMAATFFLLRFFRNQTMFDGSLFLKFFGALIAVVTLIGFSMTWAMENTILKHLPIEGFFVLSSVFILSSILFLNWAIFRARRQEQPAESLSPGEMYRDGIGVPQDLNLAVQWYTTAAESGDISAQAALAALLREGRGVEKNLVQAYKWYLLSGFTGAIKHLEVHLTPMEIEEGKRLAAAWKPQGFDPRRDNPSSQEP